MSYIFFGTPEFAEIVLSHLVDAGYIPDAVVCNPDRPVGRKKIITPPPVKRYVGELSEQIRNHIRVFQPEKLLEIKPLLEELRPSVSIVAAYAKIIPESILTIPRYGTIGIHPSLLPQLRGSSPIQSAILWGEQETGVSLFFVDKDVDHGPIIATSVCKSIDMNRVSYLELHDALAHLGGEMIAKHIKQLMSGAIHGVEQDHSRATFTKKFTSEDGYVEYQDIQRAMRGEKDYAQRIDRMVRALGKEPGVYTFVNGKRMKLLSTAVESNILRLKRIQMEGGVSQDFN